MKNTKNTTDTDTMKQLSIGDVFTHKGRMFRFEVERDFDMKAPWEEHDGHGIVSDWETREEEPGERVLSRDGHGHERRFYDVAASIDRAMEEGWGVSQKCMDERKRMGLTKPPTKLQIATEAVEEDFAHLKAWCDDEWEWVYVQVTMLKADDDAPGGYFDTKHAASLGGIESIDEAYLSSVGYELADEILAELAG